MPRTRDRASETAGHSQLNRRDSSRWATSFDNDFPLVCLFETKGERSLRGEYRLDVISNSNSLSLFRGRLRF